MDDHSLKVLEFDKIKALVAERSLSELARARALEIEPLTDCQTIIKRLTELSQLKEIITSGAAFPLRSFSDCTEMLRQALVPGSFLEPGQLLAIADLCAQVCDLIRFRKTIHGRFSEIQDYLSKLKNHQQISKEISQAIENNGAIKDSASPALARLRRQKSEVRQEIISKLEVILLRRRQKKSVTDQITIRDNRYVIPVAERDWLPKQSVIHDRSASGATYFVEPLEIVEANNRLRELQIKERLEIDRILRVLTDLVRKFQTEIQSNQSLLVELDCLRARVYLSIDLNGNAPLISPGSFLKLRDARHPLLVLKAKKEKSPAEVVPLNIQLGQEYNGIVITGPNTGGKTVALKTIGLLIVMAQAGLHIPGNIDSEIGIFSQIWADVGDEQSIEASLSTFSSHIGQIIRAVKKADKFSLVLLDELGAGTDPKEGAALGEAVFLNLLARQACVVATTHYSALKTLAQTYPQIRNASLDFDSQTLRPTFNFSVGLPGSSYAIEIAERLGMPKEIISQSGELLGSQERSLVKLLEEVKENLQRLSAERQKVALQKSALDELEKSIEIKRKQIAEKEKKSRISALDEARAMVRTTRREMEKLVTEIRETQADKEVVKKAINVIKATELKLAQEREQLMPEQQFDVGALKVGDWVVLAHSIAGSQSIKGQVVELSGKDARVKLRVGNLFYTIPKAQIIRKELDTSPQNSKPGFVWQAGDAEPVPRELSVRGLTVAEAIERIDKFLDRVVLYEHTEVTIIHGKGTGTLRKKLGQYLKEHPLVLSTRLGQWNEGGEGVTIVTLKKGQ